MAGKKLTHCTFAIAAVLSAAAMLLPTTANAQYRHYRHSWSYPSHHYYAPRTDGYYAPAYRGHGNIYGGGLGYYGDPGYSSMDSNGQRRTGSDVPGGFGGMGR